MCPQESPLPSLGHGMGIRGFRTLGCYGKKRVGRLRKWGSPVAPCFTEMAPLLTYWTVTSPTRGRYYYHHFTDEDTDTQVQW